MRYLLSLLSVGISAIARGAEHGAAGVAVGGGAHAEAHPVLSSDGAWVPIMLIIIGGMFLAAAVIGPVVRANAPEEPPAPDHGDDAHGHVKHGHVKHGHGHDPLHPLHP